MFVCFQFQKYGKVWLTEAPELKIVEMRSDFRVFTSQLFVGNFSQQKPGNNDKNKTNLKNFKKRK